ncbi:MAG TPA: tetratricopeptide repeat protein, partial [Holophagaceae bacterium]|nr:tetratricopeptide repeat protein [Holophagaceae bacterium]
MTPDPSRPNLAATLGYLHQSQAEGELVLEQNDGIRRLFLMGGDLCYLRSDAVGEQFGNYLIRLGVLDYNSLKDLLKEPGARVGERVVQWGLITSEQRDLRLRELFSSILLHAVEHPVLSMIWNPGKLPEDQVFALDHRELIWDVYRQMTTLDALTETFTREEAWHWTAQDRLLDAMADLTLTPQIAFGISQLGREPMSFATMASVMGLDDGEAARLVAALWALGGLELASEVAHGFPGNDPGGAQAAPRGEEEAGLPPETAPRSGEPTGSYALPPEPPSPEPPPPESPLVPPPVAEAAPDLSLLVKARTLFQQAEGLSLQGRPGEAIRALEEAIKLDSDSPRSYDYWMLLGDLRQGNPAWSTRAVEAYQVAARVRPRSGDPWMRMGHLYQRKGFAQNAAGCFQRAVELDPSLEVPGGQADHELAPSEKEGLFGRLRGFLGGEKR